MKGAIQKIGNNIDLKISKSCDRVSIKYRIVILLFLCFLFFAITLYMFIDVFYLDRIEKIMEIEHIESLKIQQDTIKIS
jgi:hypothetical protein